MSYDAPDPRLSRSPSSSCSSRSRGSGRAACTSARRAAAPQLGQTREGSDGRDLGVAAVRRLDALGLDPCLDYAPAGEVRQALLRGTAGRSAMGRRRGRRASKPDPPACAAPRWASCPGWAGGGAASRSRRRGPAVRLDAAARRERDERDGESDDADRCERASRFLPFRIAANSTGSRHPEPDKFCRSEIESLTAVGARPAGCGRKSIPKNPARISGWYGV